MKRRLGFVLVAVAIWIESDALRARQQSDQRFITEQLLNDDMSRRVKGLELARQIDPQSMALHLREALFTALDREAKAHSRAYESHKRGVPEYVDNPEFIGALARVVAGLRDPKAISALAASLGTGFTVVRALADFGESATPALLEVVKSNDTSDYAVSDGLTAVRFIVERSKDRPLSAGTISQIRLVAHQRLSGNQDFTILWRAIDLASVLGDPGLMQTVESLASDPAQINARGVMDVEVVEMTRKRAADRLAGIAPLPRP